MADQAVGELIRAQNIGPTDLFLLEQSGVAKSIAGQVLLNWLTAAADGHGGINKIEKLRTSGLVDTYRITLADTTTFDFTVNNGKSITGISKTGTQGLVDTYTITYNDGQSTTFKVTNGAKGDKGDNAYTWIKYASQKPTESSHSIGDVPDNWIGVYTGNKSSAPSDWKEYKWFQWKGNTGNTGDPARLVTQEVKYQVGDSGSIIPSGNWQSSVPVTPQGKYLWVRTTLTFNSGSPVVSYAVSHQGLDGSGSVSSVAGISPDPQGNVPLSAADVGALATTGGDMTGPIEMNGQPISGLNPPTSDDQPETMGHAKQNYVAKANVVNNFTTTEAGFVADARALKVLNDSKLSMEVLWENASPTSAFDQQSISEGVSEGSMALVIFRLSASQVNEVAAIARYGIATMANATSGYSGLPFSRTFSFGSGGFFFSEGYLDKVVSNSNMIPTRIYIIKGVSA